jgi:hypothetical protein
MNRREAVRRATFLLGGAITFSGFGACEMFNGVLDGENEAQSIASQESLIAEIADTFIPDKKGVPGAKAAGLGPFIVMMMRITFCFLCFFKQIIMNVYLYFLVRYASI